MITASLLAENTFSPPLRIGNGQIAMFTVTEGTTDPVSSLDATLTAQIIMDASDPSRPNASDSRWTDVEDFLLTSTALTQKTAFGDCWFRVGIKTGNYTTGQADIILKPINIC